MRRMRVKRLRFKNAKKIKQMGFYGASVHRVDYSISFEMKART